MTAARNTVCDESADGIEMADALRRRVFGGLTAAGGAGTLVVALALFDERVRDQIASALSRRGATDEMAGAAARARELLGVLVQAVTDQSIEHAPLVLFGLAALVLILFMLRI